MEIEENVPLAPLTTFGIGGLAAFLIRVTTIEELQEALSFAKKKELQVLILGGGSNMLVPDAGWAGLVIKIEIKGIEFVKEGEYKEQNTEDEDTNAPHIVIAGAGESWNSLVERSVKENLWGIENLSGIPGTVGGAVVQNIGAYGAALSQTCLWVEVYDTKADAESDGAQKILKMSAKECAFGYRDSFFKHDAGRYIVLRAAFALSSTPKANILYKDLAARFTPSDVEGFEGTNPALSEIRAAVLEIRKDKFPDLSLEGTAGSFFKNPIVSNQEAQVLKEHYPDLPIFGMPETSGIKVPLAWFLDKVLNLKGMSVGGARLYEKQPLVIVAQKNTPAADVMMLAQKIKKEVNEKLNIEVEEEVKII